MPHKLSSAVLVAGMLAAAAPAMAERGAFGSGGGAIELGARLGVGLPFGHEGAQAGNADPALSDDVKNLVPIWIDAGYRFTPSFSLGLSFQYAFGFINKDQNPFCTQAASDCSTHDTRVGLNATYHFMPGQKLDPWVGFGLAYEWLTFESTVLGVAGSGTASGTEFANLQVGGDLTASRNVRIGPFASFSFGEYGDFSTEANNRTLNGTFANKSVHEWLILGVRGAFDVGM